MASSQGDGEAPRGDPDGGATVTRTILVGDVHGCSAELSLLLDRLAFGAGDRLVLVGDLVVRGPDPAGVIDLCAKVGGHAVRGNHEDRLLAIRARRAPANAAQRATMARLEQRHWDVLEGLPLWIDLPDLGVRVVHAGVVPGVPIEQQDPRDLMYMRCLDAAGAPLEKRSGTLWGARYAGPPHVVFGHNAASEPQLHASATGIDTGCVYGGRLTALVLPRGATLPPVKDRRDALVSVPARRAYADD
jgi:hypothetical protein